VSGLDGIEEIAEQTSFRVNERTKHGRMGGAISPSIERAYAAREKKEASTPSADKPKPSTLSPRKTANLGRLITNYRGLIETCRARADELSISRQEIDRLGGLPVGYSGKLLGNPESSKEPKRMWPVSLEAMLGVLGLQVIVIEDPVATARTLALREPVDSNQQRFGNVSRLTPKLLAPPTPPAALTTVHGSQDRGGKYG
jgi:hypothetical protein